MSDINTNICLKHASDKINQKFSYAGKPMQECPAVLRSVGIATEKLSDLQTSYQTVVFRINQVRRVLGKDENLIMKR